MRKRSGRFSSSVCTYLLVLSSATNTFDDLAVEQEEDFSWEDDDDETPSTSDRKPVAASTEEPTTAAELPTASSGKGHTKDSSRDTNTSSPQLLTPAGTSPRASEDGSYDVVPSGHASNASAKDKDESDGDSDWE